MRIAIDAMGGDAAPDVIVEGAMKAAGTFSDLNITLIGNEERIRPLLKNKTNVDVIHTDETIGSDEEPVKAIRRKKQAPVVRMMDEVKEERADACISAGNTGALVSAGLFGIGRMKGISRPGLAPTLPTMDGSGFLLLDVGANPDARPDHLVQYARMGAIYAESVRGITSPRIGLLNVGSEEGKGNHLSQKAFTLLQEESLHFIGNVEARDLMNGIADVVVCDGFSGNLVLKSMEGTALSLFSLIKKELTSSLFRKMAAAVIKPGMMNIKNRVDYSEYGGAALFGLTAPVVKAHGSSDGNAIFNAFKQARSMVQQRVVATMNETVKQEADENGED